MPKKCIETECNKFASFNISSEKYGLYCFTHKKDDMVNVNIIRCIHNKRKARCTECGGSEICKHNKQKDSCRDCCGSQICEHNKRKSYCRDCGGSAFCEHNIEKSRCRECGGSAFCQHDRIKSRCKECGGNEICEHNKRKSTCKKCGGSEICEHNKYKSRCRDCGGSQICEHNIDKTYCKKCKGSQICEHNKHKSGCRECGGSKICEHNKYKSQCRDCGGSKFCEHNKYKSRCKDCGGSEICEHNIRKSACKDCRGSQICEHNRIKSICKECKGSQICIHNKHKRFCKECGGSSLCKSSWCEILKNKKYEGYCFNCFFHLFPDRPNIRNYKTKEKAVVDYILKIFPNFTWNADRRIENGCSKKRPDLLIDLGYQVIVVEVDENQHELYDCSCENKRLMLLSQDVGHRPMVFIRFNPDDYLNHNEKITSCWANNKLGICTIKKTKVQEWNQRLEVLHAQIEYWSNPENRTEKTIEIIQLFYNCD